MEMIKCSYITGKKCNYIPKGNAKSDLVKDLIEHMLEKHSELTETILLRIDELVLGIKKLLPAEQVRTAR